MMCKHRFVCYFRCLMVKDVSSFSCYACWWIDRQVKEAPKPDVFVEKATDTTGSRKFCHVFRGEICWLKSCSCTHVVYPSLSHDFYGFIPQVVQDFIAEFTRSPWLLVWKGKQFTAWPTMDLDQTMAIQQKDVNRFVVSEPKIGGAGEL